MATRSSTTLVLVMVGICFFTVESTRTTQQHHGYYRARPAYNPPSTVGFTVVKTANQEFTADGVITFDKVITNVGKAFQASNNKVKIPVTGLYYFSFSVRTKSSEQETIDLMKNGDIVVSAKGFTAASGAVVFAKHGDMVYINARSSSAVVSSMDNPTTTFSGFLINRGFFESHY